MSFMFQDPVQESILYLVVMSLCSPPVCKSSQSFLTFYDLDSFEEFVECSSVWICLMFSHIEVMQIFDRNNAENMCLSLYIISRASDVSVSYC